MTRTKISVALFAAATGGSAATHTLWAPSLNEACDRYSITTPKNVAAYLANLGVECAGFTKFVENLNYSAQGLANTWPTRYAVDPKAKQKTPNKLAFELERKPEAIGNLTYANRMGNGPPESGDGYKFRGHGPIQLTGREMLIQFERETGIRVVNEPGLLIYPEAGALSSAWFWNMKGCSRAGNAGEFDRSVLLVNGALPGEANHGELRRARYADGLFQALADFG